MTQIKFGTSGWRGIIAEDFTFQNLRAVSQAIAEYAIKTKEGALGIVVGHDCRFMGDVFAREAASVLAGNGIKVLVSDRAVPTPTMSWAVIRGRGGGAVNITASHNPPYYTGVKYSSKWGGPALPDATEWIAHRANEIVGSGSIHYLGNDEARAKGLWQDVDLADDYLTGLEKKIDFSVIEGSGKRVAYDPLFSTGRGYLDRILSKHGIKVTMIHDKEDPLFGGGAPDPSEPRLAELSEIVKANDEVVIGLATDGDADRFGILDADGSFIEPNYILALLLDYLILKKGYRGGAARSVATTHMIDAVARRHGVECFETPVGFKYIGEYIAADKIAAGGEESAGFSIFGHVPEKDGIIACLLTLEMVCREKKTIRELLEELYEKVGTFRTRRENLRLTEKLSDAFGAKVLSNPREFAGIPVTQTVTIDGTKYVLEDGSWLLFRKSGTEPVVRIYGESSTDEKLDRLMRSGIEFITSS
jgi:phosphoglucomutase